MKNKLYNINVLSKIISNEKSKGKKIVHCHGVFDLLHIGHINHFESCKKLGDILVVSITQDKFVNKGPNRPAFQEDLRVKALASLEVVDFVTINNSSTAISAINILKPNFYCKGKDYKNHKSDLSGKISDEARAIKKVGGQFVTTNDDLFSSSKIINQFMSMNSEDQKKYLTQISTQYNFDEIKKQINKLSKLNIIIIGEAIIDQYIFCEPLGKSGKESVLSFKILNNEKYMGGSLAIANNLSSFCKSISVLFFIGEKEEDKKFIQSNSAKNIKLYFLRKKNSKTLLKTRYVDNFDNRKLIGMYTVDDKMISSNEEKKLLKQLNALSKKNNLIIVSDYGHGMFSPSVVDNISKIKKYKSLNAQINSTNMGFHNIRKYKNIENVIINASELRHEMRDRDGKLEDLGKKLKKDLKSKNIIVTEGRAGALMIDNKNQIIRCPAFASTSIDKVGTGDTMLAFLSVCLFAKIESKLSLFIASLAAAQNLQTFGNKKKIDKNELLKTIYHLIK